MKFTEIIRKLIFDDPLKTYDPTPYRLFKHELLFNLRFFLLVWLIAAIILFATCMILSRRKSNRILLLYVAGFMLMYCAVVIRKARDADCYLNAEGRPQEQNNSSTTGSSYFKIRSIIKEIYNRKDVKTSHSNLGDSDVELLVSDYHNNRMHLASDHKHLQNKQSNFIISNVDLTELIGRGNKSNEIQEVLPEVQTAETSSEGNDTGMIHVQKQNNVAEKVCTDNNIGKKTDRRVGEEDKLPRSEVKNSQDTKQLKALPEARGNNSINSTNLEVTESASKELKSSAFLDHDKEPGQINISLKDGLGNSKETAQKITKEKLRKTGPLLFKHNHEDIAYLLAINNNMVIKKNIDNAVRTYIEKLGAANLEVKAILLDFENSFAKFYQESKKIDQEMSAFNASAKYFNNELKILKNEIFKVLDLNYSISTPPAYLSKLLAVQNPKKAKKAFARHNNPSLNTNIEIMEIFISVQGICCLALFVLILCKYSENWVLKGLISICFIASLLYSLYFMLYAQILDRQCIGGNMGGCNLSVAGNPNMQLFLYKKDLDQAIESTENLIKVLDTYTSKLVDSEYKVKIRLFEFLFDKIEFVKDGFADVVKGKVDKKGFYDIIDSMKRNLEEIENSIRAIDLNSIVHLGLREAEFAVFLKNERFRILNKLRNVIEGRNNEERKLAKLWCDTIVLNTCKAKASLDNIATIVIIFGTMLIVLLYL